MCSFEEEWEEGNTRVQNMLNLRARDGKTMQVQENHYRNLYSNKEGQSMKYTGNEIPALPVPKSSVASFMLDIANNVTATDPDGAPGYLTVLKNFYASKLNHSVGKHSDDDPQWDVRAPIFSLSWGGTREFVLSPKPKSQEDARFKLLPVSIPLEDRDLLIMGGECQYSHVHEITKYKDSDTVARRDRINWTLRKH